MPKRSREVDSYVPSRAKRARVALAASYRRRRRSQKQDELKFWDSSAEDALVPIGGAFFNDGTSNNFCRVVQGDTVGQRDGTRITVRSLHLRYIIKGIVSTTLNTPVLCRVVVWLDKQCNGADPPLNTAGTGMITNNTTAALQPLAFNNIFNKRRFKILHDKFHLVTFTGGGLVATDSFAPSGCYGEAHIKLNTPIDYDTTAATGVVSTIRSNNIGAWIMPDVTNVVSVNWWCRLRYLDQ